MAESTNQFCASCGEPSRGNAKFCVNCGAPRRTEPVDELPSEPAADPPAADSPADPESEVASDTVLETRAEPAPEPPLMPAAVPAAAATVSGAPASSSLERPSGGLLDRRQRVVLAVGLVVIAAVTAVIIVVDKRDNHGSSGASALVADTTIATGAPVTTAARATGPASTVAPITKLGGQNASAVVRQLDAELTSSASQVAALKSVIHAFDPQDGGACRSSAADAAAQTGTIIKQRQAMVDRLTALETTPDATTRRLVTELRAAIDLSLQSDFDYQRWIAANTSTDATAPCARIRDGNADWQSVQSIAKQAGDAKKTFVGDYNAIAAKLGVRSTWTYQDF